MMIYNQDFTEQEFDKYRIFRLLGHGHASDIYLGEQIYQRTPVALKMLPARQSEAEKAQFLTHAASLTHLRHPHLVPVLDFGLHGDYAYLVMSYVPNGHLRQRHPKGAHVHPAIVLSYVQQIVQALAYLHQHNLVHRDVKPHNMLIGADNEILLSDLGITIVSPSLVPGSYDFEGTVPYAAPEQLMGDPHRASDQYALAIVIYEWLSGQWPFSGTFDEIVQQHLYETPPLLRDHGIVTSPDIEQVLFKALSKKPEQRFESISAFALALEQAILPDTSILPAQLPPLSSPGRRQFMSPLPFQAHKAESS